MVGKTLLQFSLTFIKGERESQSRTVRVVDKNKAEQLSFTTAPECACVCVCVDRDPDRLSLGHFPAGSRSSVKWNVTHTHTSLPAA